MKKTVYVASAYEDWEKTRTAQAALRERGWTVTCDWTAEVEKYPPGAVAPPWDQIAAARADLDGVRAADAFLLLTPDRKDRGCGCWTELGVAIDRKKCVVIAGPQRTRSVFCHLSAAKVETVEEAINVLEWEAEQYDEPGSVEKVAP